MSFDLKIEYFKGRRLEREKETRGNTWRVRDEWTEGDMWERCHVARGSAEKGEEKSGGRR